MTSIDSNTAALKNESKGIDYPAEKAWMELRDLISPRRNLHLPKVDSEN